MNLLLRLALSFALLVPCVIIAGTFWLANILGDCIDKCDPPKGAQSIPVIVGLGVFWVLGTAAILLVRRRG